MEAFETAAREYIRWAEEGDLGDYQTFRRHLADLIALVHRLPRGDWPAEDPADDGPYLDWKTLYAKGKALPVDDYRLVFDPFDPEDEPVIGSLSDDLADIYGNLAEGCRYADEGRHGDAAIVWRETFEFHWGHHAIHALAALLAYEPPDST